MKRYLPEGRKDIAYQEFGESPPPRLEIGKCEAAIHSSAKAKCGEAVHRKRSAVR